MTLFTGTDTTVSVTVGVDTHLDEHVAVALDHLGRRLDSLSIPTTEAGYAKFLRWAKGLGELERVGIEGSGSFGAGLSRFLRKNSVEVLEVGRPKRRDQHRSAKSDPIDAEIAARAVLSGTDIGETKGTEGQVEMVRVLRVARRSAVKARVQAANQLKAMLITAPEGLRAELRKLTTAKLVRKAASFRPGALPDDVTDGDRPRPGGGTWHWDRHGGNAPGRRRRGSEAIEERVSFCSHVRCRTDSDLLR
jgi:transposase